MTKINKLAVLILFTGLCSVAAQESPAPTPSPVPGESPSVAPTPSTPVEESPLPLPTISPARSVRIRFIPPPMEGTINLGIFDDQGKLVRILRRDAKIESFTVEADGLSVAWDGKNDAGQDVSPGKYRGRGYLVGQLKVEDLGLSKSSPPTGAADQIAIKLVTNPLLSDTRSIVTIGVGVDAQGSFLKTTDELPLFRVSGKPNAMRAWITKNGEKSAELWQDDGSTVEELRVSNIDQMMAFDCGIFELK